METHAIEPEFLVLPTAEVDRLADEIAAAAIVADAAVHRLLTAIRRFDACRGWATQGALSCAHWLGWRIGLARGAAREHVRVAHALGGLSRVDAALSRGAISYSKVRAITRVATAETEETLLNYAEAATAWQLERICRGFRRCVTPSEEVEREERWVHAREVGEGLVRIEAQLRVDEVAMVMRAIEVVRERGWRERSEDAGKEPGSRADALVRLAEEALAAEAARPGQASGVPVELVVEVAAVNTAVAGPAVAVALVDGSGVPAGTLERLACDAVITVVEAEAVQTADGAQLRARQSISSQRRTRTLTPRLRRALWVRDGRCRFPGCENRLTDAHHVRPWSRGGATTLENLVSLCRRHHKAVHEQGFRLTLEEDGAVRVKRGDGVEISAEGRRSTTPASGPGVSPEPEGLARIDETIPLWDGSRVDYGAAVEGLLWRTRRERCEGRGAPQVLIANRRHGPRGAEIGSPIERRAVPG